MEITPFEWVCLIGIACIAVFHITKDMVEAKARKREQDRNFAEMEKNLGKRD